MLEKIEQSPYSKNINEDSTESISNEINSQELSNDLEKFTKRKIYTLYNPCFKKIKLKKAHVPAVPSSLTKTMYPAKTNDPISIDPKNLVIIADVLCIPYSLRKSFVSKTHL